MTTSQASPTPAQETVTRVEALNPVRSVKIGGRAFKARALNDQDYAELEAWIQDQHVELLTRNLDKIPEEHRKELIADSIAEARKVSMTSPEGIAAIMSVKGCVRMVWLYLRRDCPDLTEEEVGVLISSPESIEQAMGEIDRVEQLGTTPIRSGGTLRPKVRRKRKRKRKRK